MKYQTFSEDQDSYDVAILVPQLSQRAMQQEYLDPTSLLPEEVISYELYQSGKKTSASDQRDFLHELMPVLEELGVKYLMVGESEYFKTITGMKKAEAYLGYALPNAFPEGMAGQFTVFYCPNYRQVFHNPAPTRQKISQAFNALWEHRRGRYFDPGISIIKSATYPSSTADIASWLEKLIEMDVPLSADIEAFSLKHYSAGIGTITFCWSQHEGIAFPVDLGENPEAVRKLLVSFFRRVRKTIRWHHISYDVTVLIYQLFMKDICDTAGLLEGLEVMLKDWDCTRLISYLATNSCAGNELGLKSQSQEFAGNYAVDQITDITAIPLPELLQYNLVDGLSTHYVYDKHWPTLIADEQLEIYESLFKPAMKDIIQMQLTGMPLDMDRVAEVKAALEEIHNSALHKIQSHKQVKTLEAWIDEDNEKERYQDWLDRKAAGVKVRAYTPGKGGHEFNPNSGPQMQRLFYELIGLPIIEKTDTGQGATGRDVLEKLKAYTDKQDIRDLIDSFLDYAAVDKILTSFIPAFEQAVQGPDGHYYLFGNFNLGGTLSGRLSSSDPNLQNLPANGSMPLNTKLAALLAPVLGTALAKGKLFLGKLIKSCFKAPPGWLFVGLDFASLEDRISALTTRDPNKLKVYTDGYDGHSLRAHSYFGEKMPDIELAPEGARCFRAMVDDREILFHEHEEVTYLGQKMTGAELWDRLSNVQVMA